MIPAFPPPENPEHEPGWPSVEEIQAALVALRRQKLQLEQRERQLLRAFAAASRVRLREMVDAGGMPASALEGIVRRAAGRGGAGTREALATQTVAASVERGRSALSVDRVRKAPLRFRHPDDPGRVWSGRGKTPRWVLELQAQGRLDQARLAPEEN